MYRIDIAVIATDEYPDDDPAPDNSDPNYVTFVMGGKEFSVPQLAFAGKDIDELSEQVMCVINTIKGAYHD